MLEALIELLVEFFGELLLQLLAELFGALFKTGWRKLTRHRTPSSALGETAWSLGTGCVAGALTLLLFPQLALRQPWLQVLNLLLAPLAAGLLVERLRAWRESRRGFSTPVFAYAALFGLAFAATRYTFGH